MFVKSPYKIFLEHYLPKKNIILNDKSLKIIEESCKFQKANFKTTFSRDAITIKKNKNEIAAQSLKFYNVINVDIASLIESIGKGVDVIDEDEAIKIVIAILFMLMDFYKNLKYDFTEIESKILLSIYYLNMKTFTINSIKESYKNTFQQELTEEVINNSLSLLSTLRTVKKIKEDGSYQIIEKIKIKREE